MSVCALIDFHVPCIAEESDPEVGRSALVVLCNSFSLVHLTLRTSTVYTHFEQTDFDIMAMGRILIVLFSLLSCLAAAERTASQTIVIVQSSTGFATLTGTAASQALATTASGGVAGADTQAQDGLGVAAGGVGSMNDTDAGNSGSDSGSYSISTGAIVGICVGIAVLVVIICESALPFFPKVSRDQHADVSAPKQSASGSSGSSPKSAAGTSASPSPAPRAASLAASKIHALVAPPGPTVPCAWIQSPRHHRGLRSAIWRRAGRVRRLEQSIRLRARRRIAGRR